MTKNIKQTTEKIHITPAEAELLQNELLRIQEGNTYLSKISDEERQVFYKCAHGDNEELYKAAVWIVYMSLKHFIDKEVHRTCTNFSYINSEEYHNEIYLKLLEKFKDYNPKYAFTTFVAPYIKEVCRKMGGGMTTNTSAELPEHYKNVGRRVNRARRILEKNQFDDPNIFQIRDCIMLYEHKDIPLSTLSTYLQMEKPVGRANEIEHLPYMDTPENEMMEKSRSEEFERYLKKLPQACREYLYLELEYLDMEGTKSEGYMPIDVALKYYRDNGHADMNEGDIKKIATKAHDSLRRILMSERSRQEVTMSPVNGIFTSISETKLYTEEAVADMRRALESSDFFDISPLLKE